MAIDAHDPIGRGQRELIIGDVPRGKPPLHRRDYQSSQAEQSSRDCRATKIIARLHSIYVAIGQKQSNIARVISVLEEQNALPIPLSSSSSAPILQPTSTWPPSRARPWANGSWTTEWMP
jgi:F-type H+-transporting ATPase subunit alpha